MNDLIIVKAKFKILTKEEGGIRTTPIFSGYRPDHVFEYLPDGDFKSAYMGDLNFIDRTEMRPGDEAEIIVRFLKRPEVERYVEVGRKWFINEATHRIGEGVILEILQQ